MNTIWQDVEEISTIDCIATAEKALSIIFPLSFLEIIKKYNGGSPVNNLFDTDQTQERVFSNLLTFNLDNKYSILNTWEAVRDRMPNGVIPFATDPGGNLICFDYRKTNEPTVVFWNHEEDFVINEEGQMDYPKVSAEYKLHTIEFVSPDFLSFLSILYKKEEVEEDFSDFEVL